MLKTCGKCKEFNYCVGEFEVEEGEKACVDFVKGKRGAPTELTAGLTKPLYRELEAVITAFLEAKGMKPKYTGSYYRDGKMRLTTEWVYPIKGARGKTVEAKAFERYALMRGLKKDDLGKSFNYSGTNYEITGMTKGGGRCWRKATPTGKCIDFGWGCLTG